MNNEFLIVPQTFTTQKYTYINSSALNQEGS